MDALYYAISFLVRLAFSLFAPIWIVLKLAGVPSQIGILATFVLAGPIHKVAWKTKTGAAISLALSGASFVWVWIFGW